MKIATTARWPYQCYPTSAQLVTHSTCVPTLHYRALLTHTPWKRGVTHTLFAATPSTSFG